MANLLRNPGFDSNFRAWNGIAEIVVAEEWLPFWIAHQPADPDWRNRRPLYHAALASVEPRRVRTGLAAQMLSTDWSTHVAGVMQTVGVTPGQPLRLTAFGHAWSSDHDAVDSSINPGNVRMKIGIDPMGGTDPYSPNVVWSLERAVYDAYDAGFTVETAAKSSVVTVFLLSAPELPRKHNMVYWDEASLEAIAGFSPLPPAPSQPIQIALQSATQQAGSPVVVHVTSGLPLQNVHLLVSGPKGNLDPRWRGAEQGGMGLIWRWEFVPPIAGPYTISFTADGIQSISTTAQISPSPTAPSAAVPAPAPPSITAQDTPREFRHGFYGTHDPGLNYPRTCLTCRSEHEKINTDSWFTYESGNLLSLFPEGQRPVLITEVSFYASGWAYKVYVSELSLVAAN